MISSSIAISLDCQISDTLQGAGGMGNTLNNNHNTYTSNLKIRHLDQNFCLDSIFRGDMPIPPVADSSSLRQVSKALGTNCPHRQY